MAIASFVQKVNAQSITGVTAGNALFFFVFANSGLPLAITDSAGQTWTASTLANASGSGSHLVQIYYLLNANAGTHSLSFGAVSAQSFEIVEFANVVSLDTQSITGGTAVTFSSASLSPSQTYDLFFAAVCHSSVNNPTGITDPPTGWTSIFAQTGTAAAGAECAYLIPSTTSAQQATWTQNGGSVDWNAIIIAFKSTSAIIIQPNSVSIGSGESAYLQISQIGYSTYQWQDNRSGSFANVIDGTGGTTANYVTAALTTAASGRQYRCVLDGTTNSSTATITVTPATTGSLGGWDPTLRVDGWF